MSSFDKVLPSIIKSLKTSYGKDFFNSLTLQLDLAIGADYTFIAKVDKTHHISRTICLASGGQILDNIEYALQNTPCADVSGDKICIYPQNVCNAYPHDQLLIDMKIEGYVGVPLHDSTGEVIGIVVALYEEEITDSEFVLQLFELFSGRISAEIERENKETLLVNFNKTLEQTIKERTEELTTTLDNLVLTQEKLVEQEKMASLGNLVAGVAHEINTPLGVAVLSTSNIEEAAHSIKTKIAEGTLKKSDLLRAVDVILESGEGLAFNLQRSADLISNFKQVAVDSNVDDLKDINLNDWFERVVVSLKPMLAKNNVTITLVHPEDIIIFTSYASLLSQVLINLITNCNMHAFETTDQAKPRLIELHYQIIKKNLQITIKDNGQGICAEAVPHIFEPFYTSKRGQGGTGLGLSIVNNIVKGRLEGEIDVFSDKSTGTEFLITLPILSRHF